MKILFVITGLKLGGAEVQVCALADELVKLGHRVMLLSLTGDGDGDLRPTSSAVEVVRLKMRKTPLKMVLAYLAARKMVKAFQPDVVHSHMVHANIFSRLLRLTTAMPKLINSAHSANEGGRLRMFAYRLTDSLADVTTNVSQEALDVFLNVGAVSASRAMCVYNGIDTTRFCFNQTIRRRTRDALHLSDDTVCFLAVGRLTAAKDYPNLLQAYALYRIEARVQSHLLIVGQGELDGMLRALISELGLQEHVTMLGARPDVNALMNACDIFVLASAWEGFGLVVAEAMASERVVIGTDCGGVKEVISEYGFLLPPRNHALLAATMAKACQLDPQECTKMGCAARAHVVKHFSLEHAVKRWLELYQEQERR